MNETGPHLFQMDEWISCAPYERLLKIQIIRAKDGYATLSMPFVRHLAQGAGLMHGGALVSLADTAVVMAIKSVLPPLTHFATISLESRFLHPVKSGSVTAEAGIFERDGAILKGKAVLFDDQGREVMHMDSVFKVAKDTRIRSVSCGDTDE